MDLEKGPNRAINRINNNIYFKIKFKIILKINKLIGIMPFYMTYRQDP